MVNNSQSSASSKKPLSSSSSSPLPSVTPADESTDNGAPAQRAQLDAPIPSTSAAAASLPSLVEGSVSNVNVTGEYSSDSKQLLNRMSRIRERRLSRLEGADNESGGFIDRTMTSRSSLISSPTQIKSGPSETPQSETRIAISSTDPSREGDLGNRQGREDGGGSLNMTSYNGRISNLNTALTLSWNQVRFSLTVNKRHKRILHGVSGEAKPGEMVAIMGSTGAGKSTLLNILSGRVPDGSMHGEVLVNDGPRPWNWNRIVGYVEQEERLYEFLTVRETFKYAALLRLPRYISREQKMARVDQIMIELGLVHVANTFIGSDDIRGVSGGERKRVSIGIELMANPRLLLLDEPTSGLDAFTAYNIVEAISVLAIRESKTIVMTLHQPREDILFLFDKVMLFSEGKTIYFGSTLDSMGYFEKLGFICPNFMNPADFFMDTITIDSRSPKALADSRARLDKFHEAWGHVSEEYGARRQERLEQSGLDSAHSAPTLPVGVVHPAVDLLPTSIRSGVEHKASKSSGVKWNNSWLYETYVLLCRCMTDQLRNRFVLIGNIVLVFFYILLVGFVFFQVGLNQASVQARIGVLFFIVLILSVIVMQPLFTMFPLERPIYVRERASGVYRASTVFIAKSLSIFPFRVSFALLLGLSVYYMIGLHPSASNYFIFQGILICIVFAAQGLGLIVGSVSRTVTGSQIIGPMVVMIFYAYAGNLIAEDSIPPEIRWLQYLSFAKYAYSALMTNEFAGLVFYCDNGQLATESAPCSPGYSTGDQVLVQLQLTQFSIAACCLIMVGLGIGFHFIAYIALYIRCKPAIRLTLLPADEPSEIAEEESDKASVTAIASSPTGPSQSSLSPTADSLSHRNVAGALSSTESSPENNV